MKKRILSSVLALCLVLPLLPVNAWAADTVDSGKCGANVTWTLDSAGVLTISGTGPMGNWGDYIGYDKARVFSVVIEKGVTSIGYMAFNECNSLTSVTIPDSVASIGIHAFTDCRSLTGVTIPSSVTSIGTRAFDGCRSLTSVTIPDGVTTIGTEAFRECVKLTSVTIPGSLSNIGDQTFYGCSGLTDVTIQNGVSSIGNEAFWGCSSLTSAVISDSVTRIGDRAFLSCSSLANMTLPNNVTSIGERAFFGCSSLASVTIPSGVDSIGTSAFCECTGLTSVTIQSGVKNIGEEAFSQCSSLTSVAIPDSVTSIGNAAFRNCSSLTGVMIPDSVTSIGNAAFFDCSKLASVNIPDSVTSIGTSVFNECSSLTSVGIPSSVTSIEDFAFYHCARLADVYYGGSKEDWEKINIVEYDGRNIQLNNAAKHYQSQMPESFVVMFNSQGGSPVGSQIVLSGKKVTEPKPGPTRTGYSFQGWYQEEAYTNIWRFFEHTVSGNMTLHAKWAPASYRVAFNLNGGTGSFPDQTVPYGGKATEPATAPLRAGHIFGGWYREKECINAWDFDKDTVTGDTTLYAKWTPVHCSITFELHGGTGDFPPQSLPLGATIPAPDRDPVRSGHTFSGWYLDDTYQTPWHFDTDTLAGNITLHAKWTADPVNPQSHTVTFDSQGGTTISSQTVTSGGKATLPDPAPTRTDYTFQGWYKEQACTTPWNFDTDTVSKDITLYAKWTKDTPPAPTEYTVTFDSQGGTAISSQTVTSGGKATLPDPAPTRTDYTFQGWYKEQACTTPWNFNTHTVSKDITLYAKWTKDTPPAPTEYTVTFDSQGGTAISSQTVISGGKATLPDPAPTRTDYTFQGWYKEQACTTPWNFDTDTVNNNTTLYAKWEPIPKSYTITLNPNGGALPDGQSATLTTGSDGKLASLPQDPTRENYTFKGWTTLNGTAVTTDTEFTSNTTIYAQWENENGAETYTVSFHLNYENAPAAPAALTTGADHKLTSSLPTPERTGYTFDGWFTDATNGIKIQDGDPFFASTTLYAHWTKNSGTTDPDDPKTFTITFHANGGEGDPVAAATGTDGKVAVWPKNPTRTGYIFDGWYTDVSGGTAVTKETVFEQDVTVYAHWTAEEPSTPDITRYPIYWPGSVYGGRVYVSHSYAAQGTRVTIEVSPRNNYELDRLSVINLDTGRAVRLTEYDWDEYTFVMPASAVEIEVSYDFIDSLDHYSAGAYFILPEPQIPTGPNAWYYRDRHIYHINNGLVPDGTPVTRDMFLSILYNLSGSHTNNSTAVGSETNNAQTWATSHNIVPDIYASGLWGPDKALSREQAAMLIFGYAGYRNYSVSQGSNLSRYVDYNQIRPIARTAMSWVLATNLMPATTASTLSPQAVLTCGQAGNLIFQFQTNVARNYSFY